MIKFEEGVFLDCDAVYCIYNDGGNCSREVVSLSQNAKCDYLKEKEYKRKRYKINRNFINHQTRNYIGDNINLDKSSTAVTRPVNKKGVRW